MTAVHDPAVAEAALGDVLLDEVASFLGRFVAFPSPEAQTAVTLWTAHAHMVRSFESTPRLALLSPEPGSGKSRVLEVLELLVPAPLHILNASPAAVFRVISADRPTLLFDEVDAIFGRGGKGDDNSEDLRALLNAGHRRSATIPRCVGPTHSVEHFPVFAPVALAGLGNLPDTLMTRSVVIPMRRRLPHEYVEPFRRRRAVGPGNALRDQLATWSQSVADECGEAWPDMPDGIVDRPADVWEPLLAIADAAGGTWPKLGREACVALNEVRLNADPSVGVRLLGDIRTVLATHAGDRMFSAQLVERLNKLEESRWSSWNHGGGMSAADLARILKDYGVESRNQRIGDEQRKGYAVAAFDDAFARYLPPLHPGDGVPPSHVPSFDDFIASDQGWDGGTDGTAPGTVRANGTARVQSQPHRGHP